MGPDKKKILKDFQVANLFEGQEATRGQNIEKIWREFYRLYKIMHQKSITNEEINQFEVNGSMIFAGTVNSANQQQVMYDYFLEEQQWTAENQRDHDTPIKYTRKSLEIKT
ncbi:hypothetical protein RhiirA1_479585 [Rhizophagus irregularis]|uniref:Uncharacterized protein n=1 Tax=Rhizophagus irregularis TaxID=588596 RepID=A0A2N0QQG9_9GLOM|nr:hypothetical protein RhiirA1_479585 [Rhizophagus irregularis]